MTATAAPNAPAPAAAGPRFLPESERGLVVFLFAPSLPWNARMATSAGLALGGLALQGATGEALPGAFLLLAAAAFLVVRGCHLRPDPAAFAPDAEWATVPAARLRELVELDRRRQAWDTSPVDITNTLGFFTFLLLCALAWFLASSADPWVALLGVDAFVLLAPHWLTGWKRLDDRPKLIRKAAALAECAEAAGDSLRGGELEALALTRGGAVPDDLKLRVSFAGAPEGFLGVHGQCVLNEVKGTLYPYFYCCVVAREGFGLAAWHERLRPPAGAVKEWKTQSGAEVIVIRQATTRTSGYHTPPAVCAGLLASACALGAAAAGKD